MPAKHVKARHWITTGIFDALTSFHDFEQRINGIAEEKDRGDVFEIFVESFLATQPIMQCVTHWVVGDIPLTLRQQYNLPSDAKGIDGVYESRLGTHVAYQVKYRQKGYLTYTEVAPFLGITERFTERVIFTTAGELADDALNRGGMRLVRGDDFRALEPDDLARIEAWLKAKPLPRSPFTPKPYQADALADIRTALNTHDRATVVMACGTGKTLVSLWASQDAQPKTVLVLVPSLTLLQQTLGEWSKHHTFTPGFRYLCVCSDQTVGLGNDELEIRPSDVEFRIDTDPEEVTRFLAHPTEEVKVIFSTYQSSPVVGAGATGYTFDMGIFDEAHKTTGREGGAFGYALSDERLGIKKRLFFTATPRHYDIRHRDKEGEFPVQSMDDPQVYGVRAHTLSFASAAKRDIICPYKVVISLIDKHMVSDFARKHGITLIETDLMRVRWVAHLLAFRQAVENTGATKALTFHSRVKAAQEFASDTPHGIGRYLDGYDVRHVHGKQRSSARKAHIDAFRHAEKGVLTNARCLTEGVDVPAVDMVAFLDPKQSRIDIAQATGRAMRKPQGASTKTVGYVVVPLFAADFEQSSLEEAIESEAFDQVADVLNALQEQDEEFVDIIRELRERKGAGKPFDLRRLREKVEVIGPAVDLERLNTSISLAIADRIGMSWDEWYGRLKDYTQREGHCRVPKEHREQGFRVGEWVGTQRRTKDTMSPDRRQRLNALGFVWNVWTDQWEEGFRCLEIYHQREGHCLVPATYRDPTSGFGLGGWVSKQRPDKDTMPPERRQRLDALGFVWEVLPAQWDEGFRSLEIFRQREGHGRVPKNHREQGYRLGSWVGIQRTTKDTMLPDRRERLDALGFVWDVLTAQWEEGFRCLVIFRQREGHCHVPISHREQGYRLGSWVGVQRQNHDTMLSERRERLEALGFVWDVLTAQWDEGFRCLEIYHQREGHCRVPATYREQGFRLGSWVNNQRTAQGTMSPERRQRLEALGFVWDVLTAQWDEGFRCLEIYHQREGHCRVPGNHREQGYPLGRWVGTQRSTKDTMSPARRKRLDALGFVWDVLTAQWEEGFHCLEIYHQREGHCRVPAIYLDPVSDYPLGQWVNTQRGAKDTMSPDHRQRLDALGFVWDVLIAQWEEGFRFLEIFRQREGHGRVPKNHHEQGFWLGGWVSVQRSTKDTMSPERRQRLEALGFVWDVLIAQWEEGFRCLEIYHQREGHCRVPQNHREQGFGLGGWVRKQRSTKDTMSLERRQRLDALGFVWDILVTWWEEGFRFLEIFRQREGHCRVPATYREQGFWLGQWVSVQRSTKDTMSPERRQRLEALGFVWEVLPAQWEEGFRFLETYHQREGHCRVPATYRDPASGFWLGRWVRRQRTTQDTMSPDHRQRLDVLDFVWKVR